MLSIACPTVWAKKTKGCRLSGAKLFSRPLLESGPGTILLLFVSWSWTSHVLNSFFFWSHLTWATNCWQGLKRRRRQHRREEPTVEQAAASSDRVLRKDSETMHTSVWWLAFLWPCVQRDKKPGCWLPERRVKVLEMNNFETANSQVFPHATDQSRNWDGDDTDALFVVGTHGS